MKKKIIIRSVFLLLLLHNSVLCTFAQSAKGIKQQFDSLQTVLATAIPDTDKVNMLLEFSESLDCVDTTYKFYCLNKGLSIAEKIHWPIGIYGIYWQIGNVYQYCLKDHVRAINAYNSMEAIAEKMKKNDLKATAYLELGNIYNVVGDNNKALYYYHKIIALDTAGELAIGEWANIGQVYKGMGDYAKATAAYQRSLNLLNELILSGKDKNKQYVQFQAGISTTISDIYIYTGNYDKALEIYKKELNVAERIKDTPLICKAYDGIGEVYLSKKDAARSIDFFDKALLYARLSGTKISGYEEDILNKLANAYLQINDTGKALENAELSLTIAIKNNNTPQLGGTYTTLGKIANSKKKYALAIKYLEKAIPIAKEINAKNDEKNAWEALSNAYSNTNQFAKAFAAYKNFTSLKDSLYNADKARELVTIEADGKMARQRDSTNAERKITEAQKKIAATNLQKQRVLTFSGFAGVVVLFFVAFLMFRNYNNEKRANRIISKANETIKEEKQISEELLLNILPEHVAEELKAHGDVQAKHFDNVTVLLTDFVSFTTAGERMTPSELVAELHACFTRFDEIVSKYNIEKIKTVGDAYLAVAGLPQPNANHAADMVSAAIEIRDFMKARKEELGERTFGIRLGINSGSVVAGIVGVKKFAYDIWGDTVNTAARMEQNSEAMKINISQTTYELVKDKFECTYRGEIQAKNKGMLKMYFVG